MLQDALPRMASKPIIPERTTAAVVASDIGLVHTETVSSIVVVTIEPKAMTETERLTNRF